MQEEDKYYEQVKEKIIDTETTIIVKDYSKNRVILDNYYEIGRLLVEAQGGLEKSKYGNKLIKDFASRLTKDLGKGYSWRNLYNMKSYYDMFSSNKILYALRTKLGWTHYRELLSLDDPNEIKYYIELSIKNNLTYRQLHEKIKSNEYKNLSEETKEKIIDNKKPELIELVKDQIVISNPNNEKVIKEKILQKLIIENIPSFLKQLGEDYYFVGNEYPVKIGDRYYKIDLLLYNMEYECYVVIELKIGELKKEHIGQIELYMNYIDDNKKKITQNSTIGIILCHKNNKLIMKYCSNPNIITREYVLN